MAASSIRIAVCRTFYRAGTEKTGYYSHREMARTDVEILKNHLKKQGESIWNFANGRDASLVESDAHGNKGYSNSTTIAFDVTEESTAKMVLLSLCETVASRLRKDEARAEVVSVSIRDFEMKTVSHQKVMQAPTNLTGEIYEAVCQLFDELWDETSIRLLGVYTSKVSREERDASSAYSTPRTMKKWKKSIRQWTKYGKNSAVILLCEPHFWIIPGLKIWQEATRTDGR